MRVLITAIARTVETAHQTSKRSSSNRFREIKLMETFPRCQSEADLKLSILEQSTLSDNSSASDAISNTIAVATEADRLAYTRIWLSEHHNLNILQGSSPEILLAAIGAQTEHIRIGSGGVMLPNHSPKFPSIGGALPRSHRLRNRARQRRRFILAVAAIIQYESRSQLRSTPKSARTPLPR